MRIQAPAADRLPRNTQSTREPLRIAAFTKHNIEAGGSKTGIYPFDPSLVLEDYSRPPPPPPDHQKEATSEPDAFLIVWQTPKKSSDFIEQLRQAQLRDGEQFGRSARSLFAKAGRAIDRNSTELANLQRKTEQLETKLEALRPDVRKTSKTKP